MATLTNTQKVYDKTNKKQHNNKDRQYNFNKASAVHC